MIQMPRFTPFLAMAMIVMLMVSGPCFSAEKYPNRPISVVLHVAPGGGSTINAQSLQGQFEKTIGASMVIVNKPGGGGTIAFNFVANAEPDGYTVLGVNPSAIVTRYTTRTGVSVDRLDPICLTAIMPAGIVVQADSPFKTFKDFLDYTKANPSKVQMGNSGQRAMFHIGVVGIEMALGLKFTHIPYKGSGPNVTALLGGHVDAALSDLSAVMPLIEAKNLRVLAVSSTRRVSVLPDIPTFKEFGFDLDVGSWYGYAVPAKTPKDRINILNNAFKEAADTEHFKTLWRKQGAVFEYMGPEKFASFLIEQDKQWKKIIDFAGFKPE